MIMFANRLITMGCLVILWTIHGTDHHRVARDSVSCFRSSIMHRMKSTVVMIKQEEKTIKCIGLLVCRYRHTVKPYPKNINATCRHVVTSASCLKQDKYEYMRVYVNNNATEVYMREIESIIYHPSYNETTHVADVALIRLDGYENFPDTIPHILYFHPLPVLVRELKEINEHTGKDSSTGILTYDRYKHTSSYCIDFSNRHINFSPNIAECNIDDNKNEYFEKKYWYTTFCTKSFGPNNFVPQGALLVHCDKLGVDVLSLRTIGLFSYELVRNQEQVVRYTALYWYKTWIYSEMKADIRRIELGHDESTDAATEIIYTTSKSYTSTQYTSRPTKQTTVGKKDYYDGFVYDDIQMDKNPCGSAVTVYESFHSAFSLHGVIFTFYYFFEL